MSEVKKPSIENILHIPLEISVELGRVDIPIHVISRLSRGMIIDLEKDSSSEVDILANGTPFAKGEVVSNDGKLGVRILEIIPQNERVKTLG